MGNYSYVKVQGEPVFSDTGLIHCIRIIENKGVEVFKKEVKEVEIS